MAFEIDAKEEVSEPEKFGSWATVIMAYARDIRVVPEHKGNDRGGELILKTDGSVERPTKEFMTRELGPEKVCPSEIQIKFEGEFLNPMQRQTLNQIEDYVRKSGRRFIPYSSWNPAFFGMDKRPVVVEKGKSLRVDPGLEKLPEGHLATSRIARAIKLAELDAGFNIDVTSALRDSAQQERLYRSLAGKQSVAAPGSSYHELARGGIAVDVANWKRARPFLERHGFMHGEPGVGQLWNDPWHFVFTYKG